MRTVSPATPPLRRRAAAAALTLLLCQPLAGFAQGLEKLGPRFDLDLDSYRKTDPAKIVFAERATLQLAVEAPRALAVGPDDTLYVGTGKGTISFDMSGKRARSWNQPSHVTALAAGPDGRVYAGAGGAVYLLRADEGEPEPWTDLGERAVITSIAVSSNRVYVADAGNRVVAAYDADGRLLRFIGRKNKAKGIPGLIIPSPYFDVTLAEGGGIWLANPGRLLVAQFTEKGERKQTWGESGMNIEGLCGCCNPIHLASLPDGRFVTSEKGIPRVKVYEADGTFAGVVAGAEEFEEEEDGLDLAVDGKGRIYVLDSERATIRVYERKKGDAS